MTLPEKIVEALAEAVMPIAPEAARQAAMKARLLARVREAGFVTIAPGASGWRSLADGVEIRMLHDHGEAQSFMLRLAPGARLPRHAHLSEELCVVLEGEVQLGDILAGPGTYHLALTGSAHQDISTRTGCLLFLRADLEHGLRF